MFPSTFPNISQAPAEASGKRGLKSNIRRHEATVRISVDGECPFSTVETAGPIRYVRHDDVSCTVEFVTNNLDSHCSSIEEQEGRCECSEVDKGATQEVVKVSLNRPEECACSTIQDHGCTPRIIGFADGHLVVAISFSERSQLRTVISELKQRSEDVKVDSLREVTVESGSSVKPPIDLSVLTASQQELLELALKEGYFDSPRGITQQALAEELGISPSMVSRRVRAIQKRLFSQVQSSLDIC